MKKAFTLAEVLITLGIIGIVAAFTLPTLISKYQKKVAVTKLKQTYSIINNAITRAKVDYGTDVNQWYIPFANKGSASEIQEASTYFAEHYLMPYLNVGIDCRIVNANNKNKCLARVSYLNGQGTLVHSNFYSFILANGVSILVMNYQRANIASEEQRAQIWIDLNASSPPNRFGRDVFMLEMGRSKVDNNLLFVPYTSGGARSYSREKLKSTNCNKSGEGTTCMALIEHDGWEIKGDYPW